MDPYLRLLRPVLFHLDAERAHHLMVETMAVAAPLCGVLRALYAHRPTPGIPGGSLHQTLWGMSFDNPLGVAAGLDKNGVAIDALAACGFGHVEIGTLTGLAQPGNPLPRLFRLPKDHALINRMGFNNQGAQAAAEHLRRRYAHARPRCILGINLGKSKNVPLAGALDDYLSSVQALAAHADYLVINVSSPNTPGLRDLQAEAALRPLLQGVRRGIDAAVTSARPNQRRTPPLLVKIAPDLDDHGIDVAVDVALECGCDGLIATNTTIERSGLATNVVRVAKCGAGGLSGRPLRPRAEAVLARVARRVARRVPIIGVGGIDSGESAWRRICLGASLIQVYSALIFAGPALVGEILRFLEQRLQQQHLASIGEAVGRDL